MFEVDLHTHSSASDGLADAKELISIASSQGIKVIALTDHDTVDGIAKAQESAFDKKIEFVPGVELTTIDDDIEIHILGYFINWENEILCEKLESLKEARYARAKKMVEKLRAMKIPIQFAEVKEVAGHKLICRSHIARVLMNKGIISEIREAFTGDYISNKGRAYVERMQLSPAEAIDLIRKAGGSPVIAHPGIVQYSKTIEESLIHDLSKVGLIGIEVFYPEHTDHQVDYYSRIAEKYKLITTGGSDYHTDNGSSKMGDTGITYSHFRQIKRVLANPD